MYHYLSKIRYYSYVKSQEKRKAANTTEKKNPVFLAPNLENNLDTLKKILGTSKDIVVRKFSFGSNKQKQGALLLLEGMAEMEIIDNHVMKPLIMENGLFSKNSALDLSDIDTLNESLLSVCSTQKVASMDDLTNQFLSGSTILLIDGSAEALAVNAKRQEGRAVDKPETENVVRGPHEGFIENLGTNITLLRRKIKSPDLRFENFTIGERTRTDVCIAYMNGIVNSKLITEIKKRLNAIQIDSVLESGYIEAFIEDAPYSIFSTIGNTEKPDIAAAKILEGRAAVFVDGSPFVLTMPQLFLEGMQTSEDYYTRPYLASFLRPLRFLAYFITVLAPATYVALSTYHQELIPTLLLYTMAAGHEAVPFPAVIEAAIGLIMFEILREAGVRLPRPIGSAVSIVGALVIGESAVNAGIISPFMVIIVALTAITSFVIPAQRDSSTILRYVILLLAGFMGGFGIIMGLLAVFIHLAALRSFGTPYLSPIAPFVPYEMKDTFIRMPLRNMLSRPKLITGQNGKRRKYSYPAPPYDRNERSKKR